MNHDHAARVAEITEAVTVALSYKPERKKSISRSEVYSRAAEFDYTWRALDYVREMLGFSNDDALDFPQVLVWRNMDKEERIRAMTIAVDDVEFPF